MNFKKAYSFMNTMYYIILNTFKILSWLPSFPSLLNDIIISK